MNITHAKNMIIAALKVRQPVFMVGSPGTAKSSIVAELAAELDRRLIDLRLSQMEVTDLLGVPMINPETNRSSWALPSFWPTEGTGIILLDEITSAPPSVQAGCYQLILDRRLGDYHVPDGWDVVAAGNKSTDGAIVYKMSTALKNRFLTIEITSELDPWVLWAYKNQIEPDVIAFLKFRPNLLNQFDSGSFNSSDKAFATQRSWEKLSKMLPVTPDYLLPEMTEGLIGSAASLEFLAFRAISYQLPSVEDIIRDPLTTAIPSNPSARYAISVAIAAALTTKNISSLSKYINRLPGEFEVLVYKDAAARLPSIIANPTFTAWAVNNTDIIF